MRQFDTQEINSAFAQLRDADSRLTEALLAQHGPEYAINGARLHQEADNQQTRLAREAFFAARILASTILDG